MRQTLCQVKNDSKVNKPLPALKGPTHFLGKTGHINKTRMKCTHGQMHAVMERRQNFLG